MRLLLERGFLFFSLWWIGKLYNCGLRREEWFVAAERLQVCAQRYAVAGSATCYGSYGNEMKMRRQNDNEIVNASFNAWQRQPVHREPQGASPVLATMGTAERSTRRRATGRPPANGTLSASMRCRYWCKEKRTACRLSLQMSRLG